MVDSSIRPGLHPVRCPKLVAGVLAGLLVYPALAIAAIPAAGAQESATPVPGQSVENERVIRLQDSLDGAEDWDIGVPLVARDAPADLSLAGLIGSGRALESEAYRVLDNELRQVKQMLQARPEDEAVREKLEELHDALAQRIEINLNFNYLYAASVYIELLRQADAPPGSVRRYSRLLTERRSTQAE